MDITIAIDSMGGDFGPKVTVPAAVAVSEQYAALKLVLVGDKQAIETELEHYSATAKRNIVVHHASEVVAMDESPAKAVRLKKDSSMRVAINLVKEGKANACVSAGNTGALMATAHYVLKTLPGVDRPAIIATLPTLKPEKEVYMLDLGANVDSAAVNLYQFAVMGSVLVSSITTIANPKVGLLNIGEEEIKGNEQVKQASQIIQENKKINYIGYVEGNDIFKGDVDVVVCDGFIGNVALKTIEGMIKLIATFAKRSFLRNFFTKLVGIMAKPIFKELSQQLDPGKHNGASLIGLRGIVIKSHGGANQSAFANAIKEAVCEVEHNVPQRIREEVINLLTNTTQS